MSDAIGDAAAKQSTVNLETTKQLRQESIRKTEDSKAARVEASEPRPKIDGAGSRLDIRA